MTPEYHRKSPSQHAGSSFAGPDLVELYTWLAGEERVPTGEDRMPALERMVAGARSEVAIVCGGLDPAFWERAPFINHLKRALQRPDLRLTVVFHRDTGQNADDIRNDFPRDNPAFDRLREDYREQVHLYWSQHYPRLHFTVVDRRDTMNEEPDHPPGVLPETLFVYNDKKWAENRLARFRQMAHECELLWR